MVFSVYFFINMKIVIYNDNLGYFIENVPMLLNTSNQHYVPWIFPVNTIVMFLKK